MSKVVWQAWNQHRFICLLVLIISSTINIIISVVLLFAMVCGRIHGSVCVCFLGLEIEPEDASSFSDFVI